MLIQYKKQYTKKQCTKKQYTGKQYKNLDKELAM